MTETLTLPICTYLHGSGRTRSSTPIYLMLHEQLLPVRELIARYVEAELGQLQERNQSSMALRYLLAENPGLDGATAPLPEREHEVARACAALAERRYMLLVARPAWLRPGGAARAPGRGATDYALGGAA